VSGAARMPIPVFVSPANLTALLFVPSPAFPPSPRRGLESGVEGRHRHAGKMRHAPDGRQQREQGGWLWSSHHPLELSSAARLTSTIAPIVTVAILNSGPLRPRTYSRHPRVAA
jgi:hypothetical protein